MSTPSSRGWLPDNRVHLLSALPTHCGSNTVSEPLTLASERSTVTCPSVSVIFISELPPEWIMFTPFLIHVHHQQESPRVVVGFQEEEELVFQFCCHWTQAKLLVLKFYFVLLFIVWCWACWVFPRKNCMRIYSDLASVETGTLSYRAWGFNVRLQDRDLGDCCSLDSCQVKQPPTVANVHVGLDCVVLSDRGLAVACSHHVLT